MFYYLMDLIEISNKYNIMFNDNEKKLEAELIKIYNSDELNIQDYDLTNHIILCNIAHYYQLIKKDYNKMIKYYLMSIDKGSTDAMLNLGNYYYDIKKYDKMEKYYLMGIEKGDSNAMFNLGFYYDCIKDHIHSGVELMKKYYLMAIELNNADAIYNFGNYYYDIKDYDKMKKYYLMAVDHGDSDAIYNLGNYYKNIEKNYDEMKRFYIMVINNHVVLTYELGVCFELGEYYETIEKNYDLMEKYYLMEIDKGNDFYKIKSITNLSNYYQTIKKYSPLDIYTRLYEAMN